MYMISRNLDIIHISAHNPLSSLTYQFLALTAHPSRS